MSTASANPPLFASICACVAELTLKHLINKSSADSVIGEGIKLLAAAVSVAVGDDAKGAAMTVLMPLLVESASTSAESGAAQHGQLSVQLVTRLATAAPNAFRIAAATLSFASKSKLQNALRSSSTSSSQPGTPTSSSKSTTSTPTNFTPVKLVSF